MSVRSVVRALSVLLDFQPGENELLGSELRRRVDLPRPTLDRLLKTLLAREFLVLVGRPKRLRLEPAVGRLAEAHPIPTPAHGDAADP